MMLSCSLVWSSQCQTQLKHSALCLDSTSLVEPRQLLGRTQAEQRMAGAAVALSRVCCGVQALCGQQTFWR